MKNSIFARFARAIFIFWHFEDVLVLSVMWNDQFYRCVDDERIWWQMFNFVSLYRKRWFRFDSRIVRTHFSSIRTLNNWKMIAETRSCIFRWPSRFRRRRVCLSSLFIRHNLLHSTTYNKQCNKHTISCFVIFAPSFPGIHQQCLEQWPPTWQPKRQQREIVNILWLWLVRRLE